MRSIAEVIGQAVAQGLLPAAAAELVRKPSEEQPWPIVLLGFFGAQFAVWPVFAFFGMVGSGFLFEGAGAYITGVLLMVVGLIVLREKNLAGFFTHIAFTTVLTGDAMFAFGVMRDLGEESFLLPALLLCALQLGLAVSIKLRWAQAVLGAVACLAFLFAAGHSGMLELNVFVAWWLNALAALLWAAAVLSEPRWSASRYALALNAILNGWGLMALLGAATSAGSRFALASLRSGNTTAFDFSVVSLLACALCLATGAVLVLRFAADARSRGLLTIAFIVLALLAWFEPSTAIAATVLAASLMTSRLKMACLAVVVLLALLSSFYYSLAWTLLEKSALLFACGVALLVGSLIVLRLTSQGAGNAPAHNSGLGAFKYALPLIVSGAVLAFGLVNYSVWEKERVINNGKKVFIALAPRDPRSLMQGDYMALNFAMPRELITQLGGRAFRGFGGMNNQPDKDALPYGRRVTVVAKVDDRGVATVTRIASAVNANKALEADEILLPVQYKSHNWALVTDAFFFPEGAGKPLEAAKFGELRALGNGQALLVGLADEKLRPLK